MRQSSEQFDQEAFEAAYATFHSLGPAPIVPVGTLEYIAALLVSMSEGRMLHNISLTAIDNMTPAAVAFAHAFYLTRAFTPAPVVLADPAEPVITLVGTPHCLDYLATWP